MHEDFAILPVRHCGTCFQTLMAGIGRHESFVEHQRRVLERSVEIAILPLGSVRRTHGHFALVVLGEVSVRPLDFFDFRLRGRCSTTATACRSRRGGRCYPAVSLNACIRPAGTQTHKRIHHKRQPFNIQLDPLDGFRRDQFAFRAHSQNRFALIHRLHGQTAISLHIGCDHRAVISQAGCGWRQIVLRDDRLDARHSQRGGHIDPAHTTVRHRTQQQLHEQHAVRPVIFGVFRFALDFSQQIGSLVVLANQLVIGRVGGFRDNKPCGRYCCSVDIVRHGYALLESSAPRIRAVRILS